MHGKNDIRQVNDGIVKLYSNVDVFANISYKATRKRW